MLVFYNFVSTFVACMLVCIAVSCMFALEGHMKASLVDHTLSEAFLGVHN